MNHLKTYEEIKFNFDEKDWEEIENEKILTLDKLNKFTDFEQEFLESWGFEKAMNDRDAFIDYNQYYRLKIIKNDYGDKITNYVFYDMNDISKFTTIPIKTTNKVERILLLKKLMRKIYCYLSSKELDPDSIKKKEELKLKMKVIDPYGEEDWSK